MPILFKNNAVSALSGAISAGATSFSVVGGQGALFPAPASSLEFFYVRIGSDASNEVVKVTARSTDIFTCVATVGGWSDGDSVQLALNKETLDYIPQFVLANTTVTLRSSGGDYSTLANLLAAIKSVIIVPGALLTVEIDDGIWSASDTVRDSDFLSPDRILFVGRNTYSKTLSSVQSSSGGTGNWSIVLNLNNVTNVAVGDYAHIVTATGGTNPTYATGVHEITNVDAPNNRITITSKNLATSAPSGAVTGTITVLKSILSFAGFSGFESAGGAGFFGIKNLVVKGDGTASTYGLYARDNGKLFTDRAGTDFKVGVTGFPQAIYALDSGLVRARYACCVGIGTSQPVVKAESNATIDLRNGVSVGGQHGLYSLNRAFINFASGIVTGHNTNAVLADKGGYVAAIGYTATSPTTLSPANNTVGNDNSYIDGT